jgi:hypothetical protein
MFAFDLIVCLVDQVLQEELSGESDDKGSIIRALRNVRIYVDDLLDASDCEMSPSWSASRRRCY